MPIDPTISLSAGQGLQQPTNALSGNPVSTMAGFAQIQNALNQNRLFQQTFEARSQIGDTIATSPDFATATQRIMANPQTAAFGGEYLRTNAEINRILTEQRGMVQTQTGSAMHNFIGSLPALWNSTNPQETFNQIKTAATAGMSGDAAAAANNAIDSIGKGIFTGATGNPATDIPIMQKNLSGVIWSSNMSPEALRAMTGVPAPFPAVPGGASPTTQYLATQGAVQGDQALATQYQERFGQNMAAIPNFIKRADQLQDALKQFPAGGWSSTRAELARFVQGIGSTVGIRSDTLNDWTKGILGGDLKAYDVFHSNVMNVALNQLRDTLQGARMFRPEVDTAIRSMSADMDPRALWNLINQARYGMQVEYDMAQKFPQFKNAVLGKMPGQLGNYETWYARQLQPGGKGLPTETEGGLKIGPREDEGPMLPGAAPAPPPGTKVRMYDPATGIVR